MRERRIILIESRDCDSYYKFAAQSVLADLYAYAIRLRYIPTSLTRKKYLDLLESYIKGGGSGTAGEREGGGAGSGRFDQKAKRNGASVIGSAILEVNTARRIVMVKCVRIASTGVYRMR